MCSPMVGKYRGGKSRGGTNPLIFRHVLRHPTIYIIGAPSDVIGLSAGEEDGNRGDLFWFSKTAQRNLSRAFCVFLLILEDR